MCLLAPIPPKDVPLANPMSPCATALMVRIETITKRSGRITVARVIDGITRARVSEEPSTAIDPISTTANPPSDKSY